MTTPTLTKSQISVEGNRCTDALADTLRGYQGIEKVEFDLENGQLKAVFDQRILSNEMAMQVVRQSGQVAATLAAQCAAKREFGSAACANCAGEMGRKLISQYQTAAKLPTASFQNGVIAASLNQATGINGSATQVETTFLGKTEEPEEKKSISKDKLEVVFTIINASTGLAAWIGAMAGLNPIIVGILYAISYTTGGYFGVVASINALREKSINVDMLMLLAALGAAFVGSPAEGAMLLFLFSLSNTLQTFAMDRSRKAIEKLLDLRPSIATVRRGSRLVTLPIEQLTLGDVVIVRPGERFPIDGEIISGETEADQATITGESMPVHKVTGDSVFASTMNGTGSVEIRVTRLTKDTTLARIVQMVEDAQSNKATTQRMLDKFENYYAIFVLGAAILLIFIPWLVLGDDFQISFYRAMTWLVVASPCALVISTPASILSAIANAAKNGVLFKGGVHLEKTASLKVVAFDKTGTLTSGKPTLTDIFLYDKKMSADALLRLAAALESRSEHPLARSIVQMAHDHKLNLPTATDFRAIPGQGVEGRVDERHFWIGNERMFLERDVQIPADLLAKARQMEDDGQTAMYVFSVPHFLGLLAVADTIRPDALDMIKGLKTAGIERVVMLTGDNPRVAAIIAAKAGVDEFHAGLLPQDKVTVLKALQNKYGPVAMVGDGVNDAPSLATADIGIAMGGGGTDVAIETADVVLMSDDLHKIPFAIGLARRAEKVVWQNLIFAMAVIVILTASAFGARLPLPLGVLGHEGSTVLVVLNGLRLLKNVKI
ncbi:MAG: heavy metal translocating P-type ATPase [Chloroflexi bacterium]|nr:heavy metal translocating P-type ATPase [Chloroflexota bacterium]